MRIGAARILSTEPANNDGFCAAQPILRAMAVTENERTMGDWFAVKGLFRWYLKEGRETLEVEERIVLLRAKNFDEALARAENEAAIYCGRNDPTANFAIEAMGWWDAFSIREAKLKEGVEIYSRLMNTSLSRDAFIRRYYPKSHDRRH